MVDVAEQRDGDRCFGTGRRSGAFKAGKSNDVAGMQYSGATEDALMIPVDNAKFGSDGPGVVVLLVKLTCVAALVQIVIRVAES